MLKTMAKGGRGISEVLPCSIGLHRLAMLEMTLCFLPKSVAEVGLVDGPSVEVWQSGQE